jgi:putative two-component system response regulator
LSQPFEDVEIIFRIKNMVEMRILHSQMEDQNRILEVKVKERTKELREEQFDVMRRLALAAEFRDNKTGIHILRLGRYCVKFGEAMGLDDAECELLLHASPLHDVGKIGIPDSILLKPGPLTKEEFEIMKTHTTIGAQLLSGSNSPVMKMAEIIALTHQEKWDGSGYPRGLKNNEIPLVAQICSVCDVFDALTTARPYKKAWTVTAALDQMTKEKGSHFQPRLVDRFKEIFPEIKRIKMQNPDSD